MVKFIEKRNTNSIFYFIALIIFVAFVGFTISGEDGLIRLYQLNKIKNGLLQENKTLLLENLATRQELKSLHYGATLENQAHEALGLAYPNETVWLVSN